jgi:hypothetical protein
MPPTDDPTAWQRVNDDTVRMPVYGGWLYRTVVNEAVALAFVAEPDGHRDFMNAKLRGMRNVDGVSGPH